MDVRIERLAAQELLEMKLYDVKYLSDLLVDIFTCFGVEEIDVLFGTARYEVFPTTTGNHT